MKKNKKGILQAEIDAYSNELNELEAELAELLQQEEYIQSEKSLYHFIKSGWEYFDPDPYIDSWHIGCIAEHVQACILGETSLKDLLICIPPRHSKSKICSVAAPAWTWGPANRPYEKFITGSYSDKLAQDLLVNSRDLMRSPWYKNRWVGKDKIFNFASDNDTKSRIDVVAADGKKSGYRFSTTPKGAGLGMGYSILIIDDPLDANDATSKPELERVINWWKRTLKNRKNDPKTSRNIVIMQRLSSQDLAQYLIDNEGFFHLVIPAEYESKYTFMSPLGLNDPRKEGELICPDRFTPDFIYEQKKDVYDFAAKYQQKPVPEGGGLIKVEKWAKVYNFLPNINEFDIVIMSSDLSMDDTEGADFTVTLVIGRKDANVYLIDMVRDRMDFPMQIETLNLLSRKYPRARTKLIERKANGYAVIKTLQNKISGIYPIEPKGDKYSRLKATVPEWVSGNIWIPDSTLPGKGWVKDLKDEMTLFPKGAHDDICDAFSQGVNYLMEFCGTSQEIIQTETSEFYQNKNLFNPTPNSSGDNSINLFGSPKSLRGIFDR